MYSLRLQGRGGYINPLLLPLLLLIQYIQQYLCTKVEEAGGLLLGQSTSGDGQLMYILLMQKTFSIKRCGQLK